MTPGKTCFSIAAENDILYGKRERCATEFCVNPRKGSRQKLQMLLESLLPKIMSRPTIFMWLKHLKKNEQRKSVMFRAQDQALTPQKPRSRELKLLQDRKLTLWEVSAS